MSFVRAGWLRRWTGGESGVYAYLERQPHSNRDLVRIWGYGDTLLEPEDFFELVMSVLEQAGVVDKISKEDIVKIAERCGVPANKVVFMDKDKWIELAWRHMSAKSKLLMEELKSKGIRVV